MFTGLEKLCYEVNPPELSIGPSLSSPAGASDGSRPPAELGWYFGQISLVGPLPTLRNGDFRSSAICRPIAA